MGQMRACLSDREAEPIRSTHVRLRGVLSTETEGGCWARGRVCVCNGNSVSVDLRRWESPGDGQGSCTTWPHLSCMFKPAQRVNLVLCVFYQHF